MLVLPVILFCFYFVLLCFPSFGFYKILSHSLQVCKVTVATAFCGIYYLYFATLRDLSLSFSSEVWVNILQIDGIQLCLISSIWHGCIFPLGDVFCRYFLKYSFYLFGILKSLLNPNKSNIFSTYITQYLLEDFLFSWFPVLLCFFSNCPFPIAYFHLFFLLLELLRYECFVIHS